MNTIINLPDDPCCICKSTLYMTTNSETPKYNLLKFQTKHKDTHKMVNHEYKFCNTCLEKYNIKNMEVMRVINTLVHPTVKYEIMEKSGLIN